MMHALSVFRGAERRQRIHLKAVSQALRKYFFLRPDQCEYFLMPSPVRRLKGNAVYNEGRRRPIELDHICCGKMHLRS